MTEALPPRLAGPELADLWSRCWRAMAKAGPDSWGSVTISVPVDDDARRRAVAGLLGRVLRPGTGRTSVRLDALDELLQRAGDGWHLVRTVEAVGGPLPDRLAQTRAELGAVAAARDAARRVLDDEPWVERWLAQLDRGMLTRLHRRGELDLLAHAAELLAALPADGVALPTLASRLTGDTKALDDTPLAHLVLRGLAHRYDEPTAATAAQRRSLWETAGVVPDDLASQVLVLNIAADGDGLAGWLREAAAGGVPFRVTLHQLRWHGRGFGLPPTIVSVCENPAVLRTAAGRLGADSGPLVCTEGRPSVAALELLQRLVDAGCRVRYHGDFDWPGLRIAGQVLAATRGTPWRFGADDYRSASEPSRRTAPRPLRGPAATSPWDPALATAMEERGEVVFEEDVLDTLLGDLSSELAP